MSIVLVMPGAIADAAPPAPRSVRVVLDSNYPPFAFQDADGKLQGISVDDWRLWEKRTGVKVELTGLDWETAIERMRARQFDVIDTIFETDERDTFLEFSRPYAKIDVSIFFDKDITGISDANSLRGFPVAFKAGDAVEGVLKRNGVSTLITFTNYEQIVRAARDHKINVFVVDRPSALYYLSKFGIDRDFKESAPISAGELHRAVRKGNRALLTSIENGFAEIPAADLRRVEEKWFGYAVTKTRRYVAYAAYAAVIGLVLAMALFIWNRRLRLRVARHSTALGETESRLRAIFDHLPDWVWLKDLNSVYLAANAPVALATRRSVEDVTGRTDHDLWTEKLAKRYVAEDQDVIRSGRASRILEQRPVGHGEVRWMEKIKAPIRNSSGTIIGTVGIARDITDRHRAEQAAEQANRHLRMLSDCNEAVSRASDQASLLDTICRIVVERGGYHMAWVGFAENDEVRTVRPMAQAGITDQYLETVTMSWADNELGRGPVGTAIRTGKPSRAYSVENDTTFLPWRGEALKRGYASTLGLPLVWEGSSFGALTVYSDLPNAFDPEETKLLNELAGNLSYGIATLRVREERRKTREALRESEEKFRSIFESAPVAIFQSTAEGRLTSVNAAGARMFGYDSPAEFMSATTDIAHQLYVVPEQRDDIIRNASRSTRFVQREVDYRRRDGSVFIGHIYIRAVRKTSPDTIDFLEGFVEDITERKKFEQRLKESRERSRALSARLQSLREEERTRIAREIHDHLGQLLTALKLDLGGIERKVQGSGTRSNEAIRGKLASARELTDEVIGSVQKIASELRPGILDRLGLAPAIELELQSFNSRTGIDCDWLLPKEALPVSQDTATAVYRMFQEVLTNVARHAHATHVTVRLAYESNDLKLEVRDDGVGIRAGDIESPKSLGILGIQERAASAGGTVNFAGTPDKGTAVIIQVPIQNRTIAKHETNPYRG